MKSFSLFRFKSLALATGILVSAAVYGASHFQMVSEAAETSAVQLVHQQPDSRSLPAPSFMIPLTLEVRNTRATDLRIRVVASRDGRIMDIGMPQGNLNQADNPVYQIEVAAPTYVLSYQFIIQDKAGNVTTSKRYVVRRPCIQNYKVDVPKDASDAEFKQNVGELISKAKILETTTANYETSLKLLEQLKTLVSE